MSLPTAHCFPISLSLSNGRFVGLLFTSEVRALSAQIAAAPLPAHLSVEWVRQLAAEATALVRLCIWRSIPARSVGLVLEIESALLAALTFGDCLVLTFAALALYDCVSPTDAPYSYAIRRHRWPVIVRHEKLLVSTILRNPGLLHSEL